MKEKRQAFLRISPFAGHLKKAFLKSGRFPDVVSYYKGRGRTTIRKRSRVSIVFQPLSDKGLRDGPGHFPRRNAAIACF